MEKKEALKRIQQMKDEGLTYIGIAKKINISKLDLYTYINRPNMKTTRIHNIIEKYFEKGE